VTRSSQGDSHNMFIDFTVREGERLIEVMYGERAVEVLRGHWQIIK
jgi:hypothetical protein